MTDHRVIVADAREGLRQLVDGSAHMVVTSPPYWSLRSYPGTDGQVWGGEERCAHKWISAGKLHKGGPQGKNGQRDGRANVETQNAAQDVRTGAFCSLCGAWKGQLGLEPTVEMWVEHLVEIFREVRRVLRDDGTLWLNCGYNHAANRSYQVPDNKVGDVGNGASSCVPDGYKPKDIIHQPWLLALALQADGWYLRMDIIWHKPNPMPESCTDRPTKSHEYVFLLSKSARYFYDAEAVKEPGVSGPSDVKKMVEGRERIGGKHKMLIDPFSKASAATNIGRKRAVGSPGGRNLRSVWTIPSEACGFPHFAAYSRALVRPCLRAGTSERGACPTCGTPWERVVEKSAPPQAYTPGETPDFQVRRFASTTPRHTTVSHTLGFRPACACSGLPIIDDQPRPAGPPREDESEPDYADRFAFAQTMLALWRDRWDALKPQYDPCETTPCVVLDPFTGIGTTNVVAAEEGRDSIGVELNPDYAAEARRRIAAAVEERRLPLLDSAPPQETQTERQVVNESALPLLGNLV